MRVLQFNSSRASFVKKDKPRNSESNALLSTVKETKGRSIVLPVNVWNALDQDAERCGRSSIKQLEAILSIFYGLRRGRDMEVDEAAVQQAAKNVA